jgi:hypothetical protein
MSASTKLVDKLEGVDNFVPGSIGLHSFLKRMIFQDLSRKMYQNLQMLQLKQSTRRIWLGPKESLQTLLKIT